MVLKSGEQICDRCRQVKSWISVDVAPMTKGFLTYDLCKTCWDDFTEFLVNQRAVYPLTRSGERSQRGQASRQEDPVGAEPKDLQGKAAK